MGQQVRRTEGDAVMREIQATCPEEGCFLMKEARFNRPGRAAYDAGVLTL